MLLIFLGMFLIAEDAQGAARGRVQVKNGTVLTDTGTLLRGHSMQINGTGDAKTNYVMNRDSWVQTANLGFNFVRLNVKLSNTSPAMTIEQQIPNIDQAVSWARELGLYVMVESSVFPGTYNLSELKTFWNAVAGRYKDETHVFYEMINEPVSWYPSNYTNQNIADLKSVYDIMRSAAPNTHIVLWTFARLNDGPTTVSVVQKMTGIDYTKTSVGFHWYSLSETAVKYLKAAYPVLMTETDWTSLAPDDVANLSACERLGISWSHLAGKYATGAGGLSEFPDRIFPGMQAKGYYPWSSDPISPTPIPDTCTNLNFSSGSVSPTSVSLGGTYAMKCDYGLAVNSIEAKPGSGTCTYTNFSGTVANFACIAGSTSGTFSNACSLRTGTSANTCARQDRVNSLSVTSTSTQSCGDGTCNSTETCSTCSQDCGTCPPPTKTYNLTDFTNLVTDWLKSMTGSPADVNLDNKVNSKDLGVMMSNWETSTSPTPPPPTTPACDQVGQNNFAACYFDNMDLTGLKITRTDNQINFDWGANSPDASLSPDTFSAKWEGDFNFEASGYTFTSSSDDGIRVYVDNQLLIDKWIDQGTTTYTAQRNLTAGTHRVKVEYYENGGQAVAKLAWAKGITTPVQSCGDGSCNNGETCSTCSQDCGICSISNSTGSLINENWENGWNGWGHSYNRAEIVSDAAAHSGTHSLRFTLNNGWDTGNSPDIVAKSFTPSHETWGQFYVKVSSNWEWPSISDKYFFIWGPNSNSTLLQMWGNNLDFTSQVTPNFTLYGTSGSSSFTKNAWNKVTYHAITSSPGGYDGTIQVWLNDVLIINSSSVPWGNGANFSQVALEMVWGGPVGTRKNGPYYVWFDDVIVQTTPFN